MDVVVNMAPISATRVRVMFVSLEEIRSDLSLLSRHAQQFLVACAQPSGSKGTGRYTPQSRAVLQCDEADRRVNNRTIAVMERRGQRGFAAVPRERSTSGDAVRCAEVRIRRWRMEVGRGRAADASLLRPAR